MKRKIVQQGPATLMISIPAKWARKHGLSKGDEIELEEENSKLVISTERKESFRKTRIDLTEYGAAASRAIGALYKQGFDEIDIVFRSATDIEIVNKNISEFIGFEIVSQTNNGCVIREISAPKEEEFKLILNRMLLLLKSLADDTYSSLKSNDKNLLKALPSRDITINKYANYCRRILNKHGYAEQKKTPMMYCIIEGLENLGDEYKGLAKFVVESRISLERTMLELLDSVNNLLDKFYRIMLKFDTKKILEFYTEYSKLELRLKRLEKTKEVKKSRVLDLLSGMSRIMMNMLGPLMTMELY